MTPFERQIMHDLNGPRGAASLLESKGKEDKAAGRKLVADCVQRINTALGSDFKVSDELTPGQLTAAASCVGERKLHDAGVLLSEAPADDSEDDAGGESNAATKKKTAKKKTTKKKTAKR